MTEKPLGKIIILTAPSGSGKTTLANFLLKQFPQLAFSVSATTRPPREGEIEGKHYFFMSQAAFRQAVDEHEFFEFQEVYTGQYYGTLKREVQRIWAQNKIALFDIDVKGARNIEASYRNNILSVYVKAPGMDVLRQRLILRGTETPETLERRIRKAEDELEYAKYFDYVITNDKLPLAQKILGEIVSDFIQDALK